jgi:mono/diheme cytochrome c family protein
MNTVRIESTPEPPAHAEPGRPQGLRGATVPVALLVLLVMLLFWGAMYFDSQGGNFDERVYAPYRSLAELESFQPRTEGPNLARGRQVFETVCALCHGVNGEGKPGQAPPLAGSELVQASPERMIRIPLYGLNGPVTVLGQTYNLSMPAMGASLSPDDLALTLTYIRTSFGNKASIITPEQVTSVKNKVGSRAQQFTVDELNAVQ